MSCTERVFFKDVWVMWCYCIHLQLCCLWTLSKCLAYGLWEGNLKIISEAQLFSSDYLSKPLNYVVRFCMVKYWYFVCNGIDVSLLSSWEVHILSILCVIPFFFLCNCICVPYWPWLFSCARFFFPLKKFSVVWKHYIQHCIHFLSV